MLVVICVYIEAYIPLYSCMAYFFFLFIAFEPYLMHKPTQKARVRPFRIYIIWPFTCDTRDDIISERKQMMNIHGETETRFLRNRFFKTIWLVFYQLRYNQMLLEFNCKHHPGSSHLREEFTAG